MKLPIYVCSSIPEKFNSLGFIFFIWIFMAPKVFNDEKVRNHEYVHYLQMKELWFIGFYPVYLYLLLKYGYEGHPMEREATQLEICSPQVVPFRIKFGWKKLNN